MGKLILKAFGETGIPMCVKVVLTKSETRCIPAKDNPDLILLRYIDGSEEFDLEFEEVYVAVFCGKLYEPVTGKIIFSREEGHTAAMTAVMKRTVDPCWYGMVSFDAHNHVSRIHYEREKTIGLFEAAVMAKGEDLNCFFAGVPYDFDHHKEKKTGIISDSSPYRQRYKHLLDRFYNDFFILDVNNEYCKYRYGHVFMLNYDQTPPANRYRDPQYNPYEKCRHICCTEEPPFLNAPISNAIYENKKEHTAAVYAHPTSWWYDEENLTFITNIASTLGFDILTGAVDAVVIMGYKADHKYYQQIWYELLDNGYFVPGIAETDACMDAVNFNIPPYRTYTYADELSTDSIGDAVKAGRCMASSGPLLHFTVDGQLPGSRLERINSKEYDVDIQADACVEAPLAKLQLVVNGRVEREIDVGDEESAHKSFPITVEADSYIHVKCYDEAGNLAIANPIYIRNAPFVNLDYHAGVSIEVFSGKQSASGTYRIGADSAEAYFEGKIACRIRPHEMIHINVGRNEKTVSLFEYEPIQCIFRNLYRGEFNKKRQYKPGEVPASAFGIRRIRELLDSVKITVVFDAEEMESGLLAKSHINTHVDDELVSGNAFLHARYVDKAVPGLTEFMESLPVPVWEGHDAVLRCYMSAWEMAWSKLRNPEANSGFVSNFSNTEFANSIFMWDTAFVAQFGKYARQSFRFVDSLDNFYAKQHKDGFICRQIDIYTGEDGFERYDPSSTGPNILAWTEWEQYAVTGEIGRLKKVFPVLAAYHRWLRKYRTWQDGAYFSSGWGCGMDNQPRVERGYSPEFDHGHMAWIDTTAQQALSARAILRIAKEIGRESDASDMAEEVEAIGLYINRFMWDEERRFYFDRYRDGKLSDLRTIGAYWTLLAGIVPDDRLGLFVAHLEEGGGFHTCHNVPSLPVDSTAFEQDGGDYWRGGVWPATNYMLVKGLAEIGLQGLAYEIARNHVEQVAEVYRKTGSVWECYDALRTEPGKLNGRYVRKDFVGFSGVGPIAMLIEDVIGIKPDHSHDRLRWDIRLTEGHGIKNYPVGDAGMVDLYCRPRVCGSEEPQIDMVSRLSCPIRLEVSWNGGKKQYP